MKQQKKLFDLELDELEERLMKQNKRNMEYLNPTLYQSIKADSKDATGKTITDISSDDHNDNESENVSI